MVLTRTHMRTNILYVYTYNRIHTHTHTHTHTHLKQTIRDGAAGQGAGGAFYACDSTNALIYSMRTHLITHTHAHAHTSQTDHLRWTRGGVAFNECDSRKEQLQSPEHPESTHLELAGVEADQVCEVCGCCCTRARPCLLPRCTRGSRRDGGETPFCREREWRFGCVGL